MMPFLRKKIEINYYFYLAVVYTDALQLVMMIGGIICVIFLGLNITGGAGRGFENCE